MLSMAKVMMRVRGAKLRESMNKKTKKRGFTFVTLGLLGELGEVDVVFAGEGGVSHCMNMYVLVRVKDRKE